MTPNLSNGEIDKIIQKVYGTSIRQSILRDRLIEGYTYEELVNKYYPNVLSENERQNKKWLLSVFISMFVDYILSRYKGE